MRIKQLFLSLAFLVSASTAFAHADALKIDVFEMLQSDCNIINAQKSDVSFKVLKATSSQSAGESGSNFSSKVSYLYQGKSVATAYIMGFSLADKGGEDIVENAYIEDFSCPNAVTKEKTLRPGDFELAIIEVNSKGSQDFRASLILCENGSEKHERLAGMGQGIWPIIGLNAQHGGAGGTFSVFDPKTEKTQSMKIICLDQ